GTFCLCSPVSMLPFNLTTFTPATFILSGIPGMEQLHVWLSIPFCSMYLAVLLGNGVLLFTVWTERSLHQPMYLCLCMLAIADLALSTTVVPKMLALFWFRAREISLGACLTQMFFPHFTCSVELVILVAVAFDRFVAICFPLRCGSVLTLSAVAKARLVALLRSCCIIFPCIFLLRQLLFCGHSCCEHMAIARLACADISISFWNGFILLALFRLPSRAVCHKAFHPCSSHVCVLFLFYTPAAFTALTLCFGGSVPREVHILLINLYVLLPPLLNPIVYRARTQQIRDKVGKVFVCPKSQTKSENDGHLRDSHIYKAC
uniref:G-protein coupled receptors family 1 profile domain-containing protein n=1 Tax=Malurus cyaneus samueli TaxID=2593467 RepID=A0A8C5T6Y2_9PASS